MTATRQRASTAVATQPLSSPPPTPSSSLVVRFGERFGVEPGKMLETLRATVFKSDPPATNEQLVALLVVCEQHGLNPFLKEIHAFVDRSGGVVPFVGVDGWARLVNSHAQFDGCSFSFEPTPDGGAMRCVMHRKDRTHPTEIVEYMSECRRGNSIAWQLAPKRMLRHRSFVQCARLAFGYTGLFDESEAHDVANLGAAEVVEPEDAQPPKGGTAKLKAAMRKPAPPVETVQEAEPPAPPEPSQDQVFDRIADAIRKAPTRTEAEEWLQVACDELPEEYQRELTAIFDSAWQSDSDGKPVEETA